MCDAAVVALRASTACEDDILEVIRVPGAWELPQVVGRIAETGTVDAIIAIGCVIRGETPHFDFVAGEASRGLMDVSLATGVPGDPRASDHRDPGAGGGEGRPHRQNKGAGGGTGGPRDGPLFRGRRVSSAFASEPGADRPDPRPGVGRSRSSTAGRPWQRRDLVRDALVETTATRRISPLSVSRTFAPLLTTVGRGTWRRSTSGSQARWTTGRSTGSPPWTGRSSAGLATEMIFLDEIPPKVSIQEAVRLAEQYGGYRLSALRERCARRPLPASFGTRGVLAPGSG
jgi:hypothetical protein